MSKVVEIAFCSTIVLAFIGCNGGGQQDKPIWKDTKLSDLAPAQGTQQADLQKISTVNIQIHIFEIPAENTDKLGEISKTLTLQPFQFNHYGAFAANGFVAGFGRTSSGDRIFELLNSAGGRKAASISLLLQDGQTDYVHIIRLLTEKSIFYTTAEEKTDSKSIGPGQLTLRITAKKNPVFRGTYSITAVPAVPPPITLPGALMQDAAKLNDIVFDCCGFNLQMSPGDFIFLSPDKYAGHHNSLGSLFFSRPGIRPIALAFLIVCTGVSE